MLRKPESHEYSPQIATYIESIGERDLWVDLPQSMADLLAQVSELSDKQALYRYEPSKWSIKQLLGHLADTERVMQYRILRIARGDHQTTLFGFDENLFVASAQFDEQPLTQRIHELQVVRQSTIVLFQSIQDEAWLRSNTFRNHDTTARAIAYLMMWHFHHHVHVLAERYLVAFK